MKWPDGERLLTLKQRVEDMGGKVVETEWGWELDIGDDSFTMANECDPDAECVAFWNTYLDGRDAQARARRCAELITDIGVADGGWKQDAYMTSARMIRREFGIEEEK